MTALEHAHGGEKADAGAERGAADLELDGQLALGWKAVARAQRSAGDERAHVVDDLHGELAVAVRVLACLLPGGLYGSVVVNFAPHLGGLNDS